MMEENSDGRPAEMKVVKLAIYLKIPMAASMVDLTVG
jgi:hypothetical protein